MASKKNEPLSGFQGQPPEYTGKDGRIIPAGEAVAMAAERYHKANPGLDESQVAAAWNNLDEPRRRDWIELALEELDDQIAAASAAVDAANVTATVVPSAQKQLGAALIDAALTEVKALSRPWQQMTADQQSDVLDRITRQVREAVADTVQVIAARGAHHIVCDLDQITVKKGTKAVLSIAKPDVGQDLLDSVGQQVILVLGADFDADEIQAPKADPDQGDLLAQSHTGSGGGDTGGAAVVHSDPED